MIPLLIGLIIVFFLFGALKDNEQPDIISGTVLESGTNTFTAAEISIPRVTSTRELFDADRIVLTCDGPVRTTVGVATARVQIILSDNAPTALLQSDDSNLVADYNEEAIYQLLESAAGVFTVQLTVKTRSPNREGLVDSTRWRNFLYKDNIWLCVHGAGATAALNAYAKITGKLDKASQADFDALLLSKL